MQLKHAYYYMQNFHRKKKRKKKKSPARGVWGPPPQGKVWISDLLRSFLVYSWGKIPDLLLNLVVFGGHRIKGVPPLRAAKQLVIRVRRGKISAPILIAYWHL